MSKVASNSSTLKKTEDSDIYETVSVDSPSRFMDSSAINSESTDLEIDISSSEDKR